MPRLPNFSLTQLSRVFLTAIVSCYVFITGIAEPKMNWDMIGYVAAAYHRDGYRGAELSEKTYGNVKNHVGKFNFAALVAGDYRATVYKVPASLEQQVPMYSIRVAYVELIRAMRWVGVDYSKGTYSVSAIFAALSVVLVALLLQRAELSIWFLPFAVAFASITELSVLSTPDAMACFFSLLTIYGLSIGSRIFLLVAAMLPLVRTDYILMSLLLVFVPLGRGGRKLAVAAFLVSLLLYFAITTLNNNYGWLHIFNFVLINRVPYPAQLVPSVVISDYLDPYLRTFGTLWSKSHFAIYFVAAVLAFRIRHELLRDTRTYIVFFVPIAFVLLHLLLFPSYENRFFAFAASLSFMAILSVLTKSHLRSA